MWALIEQGQVAKIIRTPQSITIGGITYPRNVFTRWEKAELAAIGLYPYREVSVDTKYYWQGQVSYAIGDEVVATYATTDRDVDSLKDGMKAQVKALAASKLAETDWMVVRAAEGGTAVPEAVTAYRVAVREASNTKEAEIEALADLDAVKAYEAKPYVEVRKVKHSVENEDGTVTETYGPETEESNRNISMVTGGWPTDPLAEVDPAFVSLTEAE
jgi:hypothetical protein